MADSRAIIIGSGLGGLAAAIRLAARGYAVTVFEKLDQPGGRARVFRQDGFTFDAGPTIVTAPFLLEELWRLAGHNFHDDVDLRALDPYYQIRFADGEIFNYGHDKAAMKAEISRFCAADADGYDQFLEASAKLYQVGFDELLHVPFHKLSTMLRTVPDLIATQFHRSVYQMVSRYFSDARLRMVFSFHPLLIGGNPLTATAIYALIAHLERTHGVHYAMGGTGQIVKGMVGLLERLGARIEYNAPVQKIIVEAGQAKGVRLADGREEHAQVVVSNADAAATHRYLLAGQKRRYWHERRLTRARYSMSLFVWYFGTNRQYENVPHHMILLGPRYEGLLNDIFDKKLLADDFSLYLHRPTATDPAMAPAGHDAFYVLSPVPNLQSCTDWSVEAENYRQRIEQSLASSVLPALGQHIVTSRLLTPDDFRDELWSVNGAAFSLEPVLTQTAWFRPHNQSTDISSLYFVGAGTHPGAGMPGVISSARVLDNVVPDP